MSTKGILSPKSSSIKTEISNNTRRARFHIPPLNGVEGNNLISSIFKREKKVSCYYFTNSHYKI